MLSGPWGWRVSRAGPLSPVLLASDLKSVRVLGACRCVQVNACRVPTWGPLSGT